MTDKFKELYDTLTCIQSSNEHSDTLISKALELTENIAAKFRDLEDEVSNLTSYISKAGQEHTATRNELDKANTDLVRAYVQIGKAYMEAVEDSEHE